MNVIRIQAAGATKDKAAEVSLMNTTMNNGNLNHFWLILLKLEITTYFYGPFTKSGINVNQIFCK